MSGRTPLPGGRPRSRTSYTMVPSHFWATGRAISEEGSQKTATASSPGSRSRGNPSTITKPEPVLEHPLDARCRTTTVRELEIRGSEHEHGQGIGAERGRHRLDLGQAVMIEHESACVRGDDRARPRGRRVDLAIDHRWAHRISSGIGRESCPWTATPRRKKESSLSGPAMPPPARI